MFLADEKSYYEGIDFSNMRKTLGFLRYKKIKRSRDYADHL